MSDVQRVFTALFFVLILCGAACTLIVEDVRGQGRQAAGPSVAHVRTEPVIPRTGDTIQLFFDLAGDAVRAEVKWSVDGQDVQASEYNFQQRNIRLDQPVKLGDVVVASITAYDVGGNPGRPVDQRIICQKAPPTIKVVNEAIKGELYTAKIEATDPDGGTVTLTLQDAPEGLTMDDQGNIEWKLVKDKSGRFPLRVMAEDAQGSKAYLTYEVGIQWKQR